MKKNQNFGGKWTVEKLDTLTKYLNAYIVALKKTKYKKIYIDVFAGTGDIEIKDEGNYIPIEGSVKRSLQTKEEFDHYYYIEYDKNNYNILKSVTDTEFADKRYKIDVINGDANKELINILNKYNWKYCRAVLFIDPFATEFSWQTLEKVAKTEAIDVWYLFPINALNRLLPEDYNKKDKWAKRVTNLLGTEEWYHEFYKKSKQTTLFGEEDFEKCDKKAMISYVVERLKTIFPKVSEHPKILYNSKNIVLFAFCFACSNKNEKAQRLAMKIANGILNYEDNK